MIILSKSGKVVAMQKEVYEKPTLQVVEFSTQDVITTSGGFDPSVDPWEPGGDIDIGL